MRARFFTVAAVLLSTIVFISGPALAQSNRKPARFKSAPVYTAYGSNVFIRGGYSFADIEARSNASAPLFGLGFTRTLESSNSLVFAVEVEALGARLGLDYPDEALRTEENGWLAAGLVSLKWSFFPESVISPYASLGLGPGYARATLEVEGLEDVSRDDGLAFAYTGRAGLSAQLSKKISIDAGYRYLGLTRESTVGFHNGEIGLNYSF